MLVDFKSDFHRNFRSPGRTEASTSEQEHQEQQGVHTELHSAVRDDRHQGPEAVHVVEQRRAAGESSVLLVCCDRGR